MRRIDNSDEERFLKAAVYGRSGTGKTSLGVTAPKPLILASERQCILSVKQQAKRLGIEPPPTLYMESVDDYRMVIRALHGNTAQPFRVMMKDGEILHEQQEWPETIVIDSLTDAGRIVSEEINEMSPPQIGKDGLPAQSMRYWGVLTDKVTNLIHAFRDVPCNVLFLCLVDDREVGEGKQATRVVSPSLPTRKMADTLAAACNVMGYSYRTEKLKENKPVISFATMFHGPEHFLLKQCAPLRDRETSNFTSWSDAIFNHIAPTEEEPDASFESAAAHVSKDPQPQAAEGEKKNAEI